MSEDKTALSLVMMRQHEFKGVTVTNVKGAITILTSGSFRLFIAVLICKCIYDFINLFNKQFLAL